MSNLHGTGLVIDGKGILIQGVSGAGKSLLALDLIDQAQARKLEAALIADDRLEAAVQDGRLIMAAPNQIAGKIELRGRGIIERPFVQSSTVDLVIDMVDDLVRMVEEEDLSIEIEGVSIPRCPIPKRGVIDPIHQRLLALEAIFAVDRP